VPILALTLLQLLAQPAAAREGDRVFAAAACTLRATASEHGAPVRSLLAGDELVVAGQEDPDEFHSGRRTPGWLALSTIDGPSGRLFAGFLPAEAVRTVPPDERARDAALQKAIEADLTYLEARRARFGTLKDQALHAPNATAALAHYMETEVTPRALDVEDRLAELRLTDPVVAAAESARFEKLARVFRP
jgi:hypothetical protein